MKTPTRGGGWACRTFCCSHAGRHLEALAVLARQHGVRRRIANEPLRLPVEPQLHAEPALRPFQIHIVGFQVLTHPSHSLGCSLVRAAALRLLAGERYLTPEAVGNVAEVAQGTR